MPRSDHDVLYVRHIPTGSCGGRVRVATTLASIHVRRIPVPPVMRGRHFLECAVMFCRFAKQASQRPDVRAPHPAGESLRNLLEQPAIPVRIRKCCEAAVRTALGVGTRLALFDVVQAWPVPGLAHVCAVTDQLLPCGLDVLDDQKQIVYRAWRRSRGALAELDRCRRARRRELHHSVVVVYRYIGVQAPTEALVE